MRLAGRTLAPMPPPGGRLTAELRHKSENAHRRSRLLRCVGHVVPTCAVLQADRASVQVCATQMPRPPTVRREENRIKTSIGQFFSAIQKQILIPSMGERKPYEPETISLAGRIAPDDEHDRCCCCPWHFQSRSVQARPQCRFSGVSDRQTHRCLAGKLPRLAEPAVHRTKMCLSAKSTRYFTVFVVVV